jgi:hypothetical protein
MTSSRPACLHFRLQARVVSVVELGSRYVNGPMLWLKSPHAGQKRVPAHRDKLTWPGSVGAAGNAIPRALVRTAAAPGLSAGRPDGIAQEDRPPSGREPAHPAALPGQRQRAPRVYLALWFESRWGMAALHAQAFNEAQHARA